MSSLEISFGKAVLEALLLVSCVTGMTSMVCDYAKHATYNLADVAHMDQCQSAIRSGGVPWYLDGMQLSAYTYNMYEWKKKVIRWAVEKDSTQESITRERVEQIFAEAFKKWDDKIRLTIEKARPGQKADIGIRFEPNPKLHEMSYVFYRSDLLILDEYGVDIVINDSVNWTDESRGDYRNLRFAALHEIGHVLCLGDSQFSYTVMSGTHKGFEKKGNPTLHSDDIDGVQKLYGIPGVLDGQPPLY